MLSERDPEADDSKGGEKSAVRPKKRARRAARLVKLGGLAVVVAGIIVVAGFLRFAEEVVEMKVPDPGTKVDAIVVLTGGHQRIDQAVELLKQGVAQRLFISGVNPTTTSNEIRRLTNSSKALFACCVDIGHDAIDTIGNAYETARWISEKG
ncbi:MAG TPA: YdcF family protein, partial [Pararhizobium sp.]|nr:YdcF family protein [Pararhizobium sp.]